MRYSLLIKLLFIFLFLNAQNRNDSEFLNSAIQKAISNNEVLKLSSKRTYYIDSKFMSIDLKKGQSLIIDGNGSKIVYTSNSGNNISYVFQVNGSENTLFKVSNLSIDGSSNGQQFSQKNYDKLKLTIAFSTVNVKDLFYENINLFGFYGGGIKAGKFFQFNANNLKFKEVGGKWYRGDGYDAFGDAIYLGYASGASSVANINNCNFTGYSDKENYGGFYKNLSRAGVVAEYNKNNALYLNINNTNMEGFHRGVHIEASNTTLNLNNSTINRYGCGVFVYGYEAKDVTVNKSNFLNPYPKGEFGGAKGVVTAYANKCKAIVTNSVIKGEYFWRNNEMEVIYKNCIFSFNQTGDADRSAIFENCKFNTKKILTSKFGRIVK